MNSGLNTYYYYYVVIPVIINRGFSIWFFTICICKEIVREGSIPRRVFINMVSRWNVWANRDFHVGTKILWFAMSAFGDTNTNPRVCIVRQSNEIGWRQYLPWAFICKSDQEKNTLTFNLYSYFFFIHTCCILLFHNVVIDLASILVFTFYKGDFHCFVDALEVNAGFHCAWLCSIQLMNKFIGLINCVWSGSVFSTFVRVQRRAEWHKLLVFGK